MSTCLTFDPVDVLVLRGNRQFGGGVHGAGVMPPWPSAFAGAVASRALADAGRVAQVTRSPGEAEALLAQVLGADYALTALGLLRGAEAYFPLPADLTAYGGPPHLARLRPRRVPSSVAASAELPLLPVLEVPTRAKPEGGRWLSAAGLAAHLDATLPDPKTVAKPSELWVTEARLGVALDPASRTADEGLLYTTDAVALKGGVRFLAAFAGQGLPVGGLVRLGGDGRGARVEPAPTAVARALAELGRPAPRWKGFRMVLATPGIFPGGWLPPGVGPDRVLRHAGLEAELVAAAVPRHDVISGWDLARHDPKPARKVAPAGSVYWFRVRSGDTAALGALREDGLWPLVSPAQADPGRRREGFNRVWFGSWQPEED